MKNLFKQVVALSLINLNYLPAFAAAPLQNDGADVTAQTYEMFKSTHTLADMIKVLRGKVDPRFIQLAEARMKTMKEKTFVVKKLSASKLMVISTDLAVTIEYVGFADGSLARHDFLINGKEVEINTLSSPQEIIESIDKVLPKKVSLWSYFIPEAYADFDWSSLLMNAGVTFGMTYLALSLYNRNNQPQQQPVYYPMAPMSQPVYTNYPPGYYPQYGYQQYGYGGYAPPAPVYVRTAASVR